MSEADELSLIRRAQEGDRSAFDALVRLYDQNVLRLALQVVGSPEEARDLISGGVSEGLPVDWPVPLGGQVLHLALPRGDECLP